MVLYMPCWKIQTVLIWTSCLLTTVDDRRARLRGVREGKLKRLLCWGIIGVRYAHGCRGDKCGDRADDAESGFKPWVACSREV